jgi:hypothetical protein
MKFLLSLFLLLSSASCQQKKEDQASYLVKYGNKEVHTAEFINKMMTLGFVKYGKTFYSKIYDQTFFEQVRSETLEHILNSIFMNTLSQKYELKITNVDVQKWIAERAPTYSKEDLILTLQTNNLTYKDWTNLFREQLVQHRILEQLSKDDKPELKSAEKKEPKSDKETYYKIAVLTFENQLDANVAYKKINNDRDNFNESMKRIQSSDQYSWLKEDQIPFYSKIKSLGTGRISKPFETDWGFLLVRLDKKEKREAPPRDAASGQVSAKFKSLVEDFKKDPKLQINSDLLYSLKIKR